MMKNYKTLVFSIILVTAALFCSNNLFAQGEVTRSGSTWSATVNGSNVYSGNRMFDAVNAACNNMNSGTINIRNSGDSGPDGGSVYAIRPRANQILDFHGHSINSNGGDLVIPIHADRRNGITIRNLHVTGNPRYGIWFRGCSGVTLTNITMALSNNNPVGLGIRVDNSTGSASDLTINGTINISGSAGHAVETYGIDGFSIGDVTASNTGGCGLLLNDSRNGTVGVVTGSYNNQGGGYATFRVANNNGPNVSVEGVYSRNSGRGFFSVSGSNGTTIEWVDIANSSSHGIFLEDASNTHVQSGSVSNGDPNCQEVRTSNCTINVAGCGGGGGDDGSASYYQLRNRGTGLYLDGMGSTSNGSECAQYANTTHVNAQWEMISTGSYYQFRNRGTGLFIDGMGRTDNGSDVGQWANTTHVNSQWSVQQYSGSYYRIENRGTGLYLDGMGRTSNGSAAGQWANTTHVNAQWELVPVSGSNTSSSSFSDELQVFEDEVHEVKVYPNPASDILNVSLPSESEDGANVKLVDAAGKVVLESSFTGMDFELNVEPLSAGFYLLLIQDEEKSVKRKVIID